jgi:hypothetical protein
MTPKNDDQIPVKDYSSTKLKYYVNNTFGDDLKQCFSRQNSHKQSSFRLWLFFNYVYKIIFLSKNILISKWKYLLHNF